MSDATKDQQPDAATQRQVLTQKIAVFRRVGFEQEMEALAIEAQSAGPGDEAAQGQARHVAELRMKAENAYAAARRLSAALTQVAPE